MPSGSHGGGGGGSHFGGGSFGGSHFGGSSSGNHFGGSYYHGPKRPGRAPIHFHFFYFGGRRYAVANDDRSSLIGMIFGCIFCIFFAFVWAMVISSSISSVKKIKSDYVYYQDMITYAEAHPERIIDANVQTFYENEDCGKWYIVYYFFAEDSSRVDGYTFSIYTYEQAWAIKQSGTIQLAVDSFPITTETDSINLDYKNLPLSQDGEYQVAVRDIITNILVEAGIVVVFVVLVIYTIKKAKKNIEVVNENGKDNNEPKLKYICTYCGAKLKEEDTTCPKCGSSTIETIKDN